jgi:transcriptional/translational regulatory protein YebC/TACO1
VIDAQTIGEEKLMELAMEAGAEDVIQSDQQFEVTCDPDVFSDVCDTFEAAEVKCLSQQVTRIPQNTVDLDLESARQVLKLMDELDDHDDVQNVSANFNISDEIMAEIDT